jgi:hypothetical protein
VASGEADYTDRLKDYVQVKDRIVALYELFGTARIETTYELTAEPDDRPKVICRALVYRSPEDLHPSTGTSWLYLPGTTPYTKGSEIENAETSAVGRAIGMMGILIDKSIGSANEIAGHAVAPEPPEPRPPREGSLIGIAEKANAPHDFEPRPTPDGDGVGFALKEGRGVVRVVAVGELAKEIVAFREAIEGKRVQCYGTMTDESWTIAAGTAKERIQPYTRLALSRLTGPEGLALPMPTEAPSVELFDDAEIDAILDKVPTPAAPA